MEKVAKLCCVIIVTYNGDKWIKKCLGSIKSGSISPKIFVVDNGSKDSTLSIVNEFSGVELIENDQNIGFGKANNVALKRAYKEGFENFFLLNQDAYLEPNTVAELIDFLYRSSNVGIISPIHLAGKGNSLDHGFESGIKSKKFVNDFKQGSLSSNIYEVEFVNAAAWMLNRKCLREVGLFHPMFFHYGEDKNYAKRVIYHKLKIAVCPTTFIRHDREKRGSNKLKEDPHRNLDRVIKQIVLNPFNPFNSFPLSIGVSIKMIGISKGWSFNEKREFFSKGLSLFRKIFRNAKEVGRVYNPIKKNS